VQDQPVVGVSAERLRDDLLEPGFDFIDGLARREAGSVADSEDVRVDGEGLFPERGVENDVGGLAADAGQLLKLLARSRDLALVIVDQRLAERDDVLGLGVEEANRPDRFAQRVFAELDHLLRRLDVLE